MKVRFVVMGKTSGAYLKEGIEVYSGRLKRYCEFQLEELPDVKNKAALPQGALKKAEGEALLRKITAQDYLILLDERGKQFTSPDFAASLVRLQVSGKNQLVFMCGGAFGFHESVYQRASMQLSLSAFTFSHQLVRLIFLEQLYRAFTIIRNEPYHHSG